MFVRVWEFQPQAASADRFLQVYGPDGDWVRLFRAAPGFLRTTVLPGAGDLQQKFRTLDFWRDARDWQVFLDQHAAPYAALDRACEALVLGEREVATLRSAGRDDAAAMAVLAGELGYPNTADAIARRLDVIARSDDELVLVAMVEAHVCGWIHVFGARRLESEPYAEVGGFIVGAGSRNDGLGEALLVAGETWAAARGFHDMRVRSNVVRTRAHAFYERCGYTSPKTQRVFVKPLDATRREG